MTLEGKTVLLGVTGSIAAYKIAYLASALKKRHADVHVLMTENATNFINPITFETLTGNKCLVDTFDRNFQFQVEHVSIAKKAEDVVEIQGESLQNAEHVFDKIQEQFTELISNLDEITNGIDTIADAKAQTIDAIQSISAVSQETAAASEEVTETANRQLQQVEALNEAAQNLNQNSSALANAIDLFKI